MGEVSTIGLDIAKSVFQVHGVDAEGAVVIRKRISRTKVLEFFAALPSCLVGIEACPSAHHWSRKLQALGHTVRLMPPSYVKAYLKRSKNDANDAAAICEAVTRPSMRFVPIKSEQQQSGLMLHRSRQLLVRHAVECDPRAHERTWYHLGQGPQWDGRAVGGHCKHGGCPHSSGCAADSRRSCSPMQISRQRSESLRSISMLGIARANKAGGLKKSLALARLSPPPWLPRWAIGKSSHPDAAWRPGLGLFPSSIRPAAKNASVGSQNRAIDICDGYSSPALWQSSDMRGSTARSDCGLRVSWSADRSRSLPLRWPTRSHAWPGP